MPAITLQIPNDLVERLRTRQERLPEILELGLRELDSDPTWCGWRRREPV
jgi:hypothetical protein